MEGRKSRVGSSRQPGLSRPAILLLLVVDNVLAYFDLPDTSNGPAEAINGHLEHIRGSALGLRNLTHYITRSLLEAGGFSPLLHPQIG